MNLEKERIVMIKLKKNCLYVALVILCLSFVLSDAGREFYSVLRAVIFGTTILIFMLVRKGDAGNWSFFYLALAALYNPILPIYLGRETWAWINFVTFLCFGVCLYNQMEDEKAEQLKSDQEQQTKTKELVIRARKAENRARANYINQFLLRSTTNRLDLEAFGRTLIKCTIRIGLDITPIQSRDGFNSNGSMTGSAYDAYDKLANKQFIVGVPRYLIITENFRDSPDPARLFFESDREIGAEIYFFNECSKEHFSSLGVGFQAVYELLKHLHDPKINHTLPDTGFDKITSDSSYKQLYQVLVFYLFFSEIFLVKGVEGRTPEIILNKELLVAMSLPDELKQTA